jgi:hypothetical protein
MSSGEVYGSLYKQQADINKMVVDKKRNPDRLLGIQQAIIYGHYVRTTTVRFPSLIDQFQEFLEYGEWLRSSPRFRDYEISEIQFNAAWGQIRGIYTDLDLLLFYCHQGDPVLTAELAWYYLASMVQASASIIPTSAPFTHIQVADGEPGRPTGFYIMCRVSEDREVIGSERRFNGELPADWKRPVHEEWCMGCEGFQFLATHPHYIELMDGKDVPFLKLMGLRVDIGDRRELMTPTLIFQRGLLILSMASATFCSRADGLGVLEPAYV